MICPLMSRPVVHNSPVEADNQVELYEQECQTDCAWWVVLVDTKRSLEENTEGMEKGCCAIKLIAEHR